MGGVVTAPEWIVTTTDHMSPIKAKFIDLFEMKPRILSMMLLWVHNSYYVNVAERTMIINGGHKFRPLAMEDFDPIHILYARRNQATYKTGGQQSEGPQRSLSYLLGFEGILNGESRELFLHISEDGSLWAWKHKK